MDAGEMTAGEITAGEMIAGEMIAGEMIAGEMQLNMPYHEQSCDDSTCEIDWHFVDSNSEFSVGSSSAFSSDERPEHTVSLQAFGISIHEVTVGQYSRCVAAGFCPEPIMMSEMTSAEDPSLLQGERRQARCTYFEADSWLKPMNCVTYCEALRFTTWLSEEGVEARLPSEVEWMYVAKSEGRYNYPWGDEAPSCERAQLYSCGRQQPRDICTLEAGLGSLTESCDLIGNVREWVADQYKDSYEGAPTNNAPVSFNVGALCDEVELNSDNESLRGVTKGGDWRSTYSSARPDNRFPTPITLRSDRIGFRVARPTGF
jgi:formylglycine-generating enzyme required for sulfatase activity